MWSYYGSKTNVVDYYPAPVHGRIIEPFAGTARYSLKYFDREIILVDKYEVIVKIWKWLQQCSPKDILSLPKFSAGDNINKHTYNCEEERLLVGYLVGFGFTTPRDTATPRLRQRPNAMEYTKKRIADQLYKIRHWQIRNADYKSIYNQKATWFIDAPYEDGGHAYVHSNKHISFKHLGKWATGRKGQVIVCEKTKATWLKFNPLMKHHSHNGTQNEGIWTNYKTALSNKQLELI